MSVGIVRSKNEQLENKVKAKLFQNSRMHNSVLLQLFVALSCLLCVSSLDVRLPPSIIRSPIPSKIFRSDDEITLECVASGLPQPEYEWHKNGVPLIIASNIFQISDGTIEIRPLGILDEGIYQCTAFNQYGKTMSQPSVLQRAILSHYSPNVPVFESGDLKEGESYKLSCQPTKCFPKPIYSWAISKSQVDPGQVPIKPDKRVQLDDEGNLHFSYLLAADSQDDRLYKCNVYNPNLDLTMGGSYSQLQVKSVPAIEHFGPTRMFSSQSPVIALEGRNVSLRCFYSGFPDPVISWAGQLPLGRYQRLSQSTELLIINVQQSDEGAYICKASNEKGATQQYTIHVDVQAAPVFQSENDRPHNINVTEGETVTFRCTPYAEPEVEITWFNNGVKLDRDRPPPKFRFTQSGTHLTISNVCRDCVDGTSDIRVIQCNASNTHGRLFSDGYINILKKTVIDVAPVNVTVVAADVYASFNCSAVSDDSTPVKTSWYRFENEESRFFLVREIPGQIVISSNGTLSFHLADNTSTWATHKGRYKCVASNGYSNQSVEAFLHVEDETVIPPVIMPVTAGFPWWILLIALLILLLIIILIVCCYCCMRNKGDTYPVDEKERKNGHDPQKELADSGFHDYKRPDNPILKGSRASLASSKETNSEDEISLDYGDIDAGKFTEDGSFIGDYGNRAYV